MLLKTLAVVLLLAGCTAGGNMSRLSPGMSTVQVTGIMGAPDGVRQDGDHITYEYSNRFVPFEGPGVGNYSATFKDGTLISYGFAGRSGNSWDRQQVDTLIIR